jgi:probable F420-dependent oxidoreductase
VSIPLDGFGLGECIDLAQHLESLGYTDVWTSEIGGADGFSVLAAVASRTTQVRLGTAVTPVFTRPAALIAMSAATLQGLSGGRFCLGLGSSTDVIVERWMGLPMTRPLTRVRETLEAVQLALSGTRVDFQGETITVQDFRLQLPEIDLVPIVLGALGPKMLRLAGEVADGVILSHAALPMMPRLLEAFRQGVTASGRDVEDVDVIHRVPVAVDEDEQTLHSVLRRELAGYGRSRFYNAFFDRQGYEAEAQGMRDAWARRDSRAAAEAVSTRMLEDMFVFGTLDACRTKLQSYRAAGVRTPVILPISVDPDPQVRKERRIRLLEHLIAETPASL